MDELQVRKVLNSSVVLAVDGLGRESILLGKGIGYAAKPGDHLASGMADRVFLPVGDPDSTPLVELLSAIPGGFVLLATDIVKLSRATLKVDLNPHLLLVLTDHLHFAVEREKQGIRVTNRLGWEIRSYYPAEYGIGLQALDLMEGRFGVRLPDDEAANVAFHLVNARNDPRSEFDALRAARLLSEISTIVSYELGVPVGGNDLDQRRFVVHLQFFADRLLTGKLLAHDGTFLFTQLATAYPDAVACARRIADHIFHEYSVRISDEETAYLALHVQRLSAAVGDHS